MKNSFLITYAKGLLSHIRWFKMGSCQLVAKDVLEVLVNCLGGLSLPRKSVVGLTD